MDQSHPDHPGELTMSRHSSTREKLRYWFDTSMSQGSVALVGWLGLITAAVIASATLVLVLTGIEPADDDDFTFVEAVWSSLMRTIDPGTIGGDQGWGFRFVMLVVTFAGIFLFSALIGVLSSGIEAKLDELRKGRSRVIEQDHAIILNWSPAIFDVLRALAIANESVARPRLVILADKDKVEMEDEIAEKLPDLGRTKVICRTGDPSDLTDLQIVNPHTCRSIIILAPDSENSDAHVIKCIVALVKDPVRRAEPYRIVAQLRNRDNSEIAQVVGGDETQLVLSDSLIARLMAHSSRQRGLSVAYDELLDFSGSEFYVVEQPQLTGLSFGESLMYYDGCIPVGLCSPEGRIALNPPMDRVIAADDTIVLIAPDDSLIDLRPSPAIPRDVALAAPTSRDPAPVRYLILGWNDRGPIIVRELCRFMPPGSVVTIASDSPRLVESALTGTGIEKHVISVLRINTTQLSELEKLGIGAFDNILLLGCSDDVPAQTADTYTLVTLLHLRSIADRDGIDLNVVSEMIDVRNRRLAEVTRVDDFVVSSRLVSLMLAQAAENPHASAIFAELLSADGAELHLKPVTDFVLPGQMVDFLAITHAVRLAGQVAIGYARRDGPVLLNPEKSLQLDVEPEDRVVVIAHH